MIDRMFFVFGALCLAAGCVDVPVPAAPSVDRGATPLDDGGPDVAPDAGDARVGPADRGPDADDGDPVDAAPPVACDAPLAAYAPVDRFDALHVLDDGTVLIGGRSEALIGLVSFSAEQVPLTLPANLPPPPIEAGIAFILVVSPDLATVDRVLTFPRDAAGRVRAIRGRSRLHPDAPLTVELAYAGEAPGFALLTLDASPGSQTPITDGVWIPTATDQPAPWAVAGDGIRAVAGRLVEQPDRVALQALRWLDADGVPTLMPGAGFHLDDEDKFAALPVADAVGFLPLTAGYRCVGRTRTDAIEAEAAVGRVGEDAVGTLRRVGAAPLDVFTQGPCSVAANDQPGRIEGPDGWGVVDDRDFGSVFVAREPSAGATYAVWHVRLDNPADDDGVDTSPVLVRIDADGSLAWWRRLHPDLDEDGRRIAANDAQYPTGLVALPGGGLLLTMETGFDAPSTPWDAVGERESFQRRPRASGRAQRRVGWIGRVGHEGRLRRVTWLYTTVDDTPTYRPPPLDDFIDTGAEAIPPAPVTMLPGLLASGPAGQVAVAFETVRSAGVTGDAWIDPETGPQLGEQARFVRIYDADLTTVLYSTGFGDAGAGRGLDLAPSAMAFDGDGGLLIVGRQWPGQGRLATDRVPDWADSAWPGRGEDDTRAFIVHLPDRAGCE